MNAARKSGKEDNCENEEFEYFSFDWHSDRNSNVSSNRTKIWKFSVQELIFE